MWKANKKNLHFAMVIIRSILCFPFQCEFFVSRSMHKQWTCWEESLIKNNKLARFIYAFGWIMWTGPREWEQGTHSYSKRLPCRHAILAQSGSTVYERPVDHLSQSAFGLSLSISFSSSGFVPFYGFTNVKYYIYTYNILMLKRKKLRHRKE